MPTQEEEERKRLEEEERKRREAEEEERRRKSYLGHMPINALGDKIVTIRNILQPELQAGLLSINKVVYDSVMEELKTFPASVKRDILDALKIAVKYSIQPESAEEHLERSNRESRWLAMANPVTGY